MSIPTVVIKGALNMYTGYGNDTFGLARAFARANFDVSLIPTFVSPPIPKDMAYLLTKPIPSNADFLINHIDPDQAGLTSAEVGISNKRVLWTMWEFLDTHGMSEKDTFSQRLENFTDILAYDPVSQMAIENHAPNEKIKLLQGGYDADLWKPTALDLPRDWDGPIRYGMLGVGNSRKNPWTAINAYDALVDKHPTWDVELHLKTTSKVFPPQMEQRYKGLKIHFEYWPIETIRKFYLSLNLLLAPSWGEGKNLPALEAQTTGCPVAYTNWGGHAMWADPAWGYPIDYTIAPVVSNMRAAVADECSLVSIMEEVYLNREEAKQKGLLAARTIPAQCNWDKVVEKFLHIVKW